MAPNAASIGEIAGQSGGVMNAAGRDVVSLDTTDSTVLEILVKMSSQLGRVEAMLTRMCTDIDCLKADYRSLEERVKSLESRRNGGGRWEKQK